ncbi:hypothetical protein Tco_0759005 [Tanacetum coccineum]
MRCSGRRAGEVLRKMREWVDGEGSGLTEGCTGETKEKRKGRRGGDYENRKMNRGRGGTPRGVRSKNEGSRAVGREATLVDLRENEDVPTSFHAQVAAPPMPAPIGRMAWRSKGEGDRGGREGGSGVMRTSDTVGGGVNCGDRPVEVGDVNRLTLAPMGHREVGDLERGMGEGGEREQGGVGEQTAPTERGGGGKWLSVRKRGERGWSGTRKAEGLLEAAAPRERTKGEAAHVTAAVSNDVEERRHDGGIQLVMGGRGYEWWGWAKDVKSTGGRTGAVNGERTAIIEGWMAWDRSVLTGKKCVGVPVVTQTRGRRGASRAPAGKPTHVQKNIYQGSWEGLRQDAVGGSWGARGHERLRSGGGSYGGMKPMLGRGRPQRDRAQVAVGLPTWFHAFLPPGSFLICFLPLSIISLFIPLPIPIPSSSSSTISEIVISAVRIVSPSLAIRGADSLLGLEIINRRF